MSTTSRACRCDPDGVYDAQTQRIQITRTLISKPLGNGRRSSHRWSGVSGSTASGFVYGAAKRRSHALVVTLQEAADGGHGPTRTATHAGRLVPAADRLHRSTRQMDVMTVYGISSPLHKAITWGVGTNAETIKTNLRRIRRPLLPSTRDPDAPTPVRASGRGRLPAPARRRKPADTVRSSSRRCRSSGAESRTRFDGG